MKCEYSDGTKVNYSGPLQVIRGKEVNVFIKEELIPEDIKSDLETALFKNSCGDMKSIAEAVTRKYGNRACIHE